MINVTWRDGQYDRYIIFNPPGVLKSPDYSGYWLKFSDWTGDSAALLLCNICPSVLQHGGLQSIAECLQTPHELKILLSNVINSLKTALYSEEIKATYQGKPKNYRPVSPELPPKTGKLYPLALSLQSASTEALDGALLKPQDVVKWAHSKRFEIPEPLNALLDTRPAQEKKTPRSTPKKKRPTKETAAAKKQKKAVKNAVEKEAGELWDRHLKGQRDKKRAAIKAIDERKFTLQNIPDWAIRRDRPYRSTENGTNPRRDFINTMVKAAVTGELPED
jgi:hypothetical protein